MERLQKLVDEGSFYEAHQHMNTICFRHIRTKRYDEVFKLMEETVSLFVKNGKIRSAADIARDLIDNMVKAEIPVEDWSGRLEYLFKTFTKVDNTNEEATAEAKSLLVGIMQHAVFSAGKLDPNTQPPPALHTIIGRAYLQAEEYPLALSHFLQGSGALDHLSTTALQWARVCPQDQADLVLTKVILSMLDDEARRIHGASTVLRKFCLGCRSGPPPVKDELLPRGSKLAGTPLVHFVVMLIRILRSAAKGKTAEYLALFNHVVEHYKPELDRDGEFAKMLQSIAEIYFGVKPPAPSGLGGLFSMLTGM